MKKLCIIIRFFSFFMALVLSILLINIGDLNAQISYGGIPYSFTNTLPSKQVKSGGSEIKSIKVKDLDMNKVNKELEDINGCKNCHNGFYYGKEIDVNIDFFEQATKSDYSDEETIWILKFESDEAKGYQFIFDEFYLPFGAKLFIYNENKSMLLGAFTSENNREDMTFFTQYINGKSVYLEYIQPKNDIKSDKISIKKVVYIFNECFLNQKGPFSPDGAAKCHVNAVTGWPETKDLNVEIKSTVLILEKAGFFGDYWGVCSGALINDGLDYSTKKYPYILTANHCYENMGEGTFNDTYNWLFLFRHEVTYRDSDGSDVKGDLTKSALGGRVLVRDEGSKNSDYLLLELSSTINDIAKFDIAFAGYDLTNYFVEPGNSLKPIVGVHHPKGDVKKLTITSEPVKSIGVELIDGGKSFDIIEGNTHWEVKATKGFKTEGGSSGSPLFDSNHRVIGTCRGGNNDVTCSSNRDLYKTIYGKLSRAPQVTSSIFAYLIGGNQADPYIPKVEETPTRYFTKLTHYPNNMTPNHASPEIYCKINSDVGSDNEKIIVECFINRYSMDATRYEYTSDNDPRYFMHREEISLKNVSPPPPNPRNYFADITFKLPVFKNNGTYRYEINVYRKGGPNTSYIGYLLVSDGDCDCAKIKLELINPQERYAPGSTIKVKESSTIDNLSYALEPHNSYSCYSEATMCLRPKKLRWQPHFVGIGRRNWILNSDVKSSDEYTTAYEYISTNPGKYYTSSEKTYSLSSGVHYIGVQLELAKYYAGSYQNIPTGENQCMPPISGWTFHKSTIGSTLDSRLSKYIRVIIADCNGTKTISNPDDPLLLPSPTDEKLVGVGNITIGNVSMDKYKIYNVEAYKSIILKPGFHIKEGTKFTARIVPCPPIVKNAIAETKSAISEIKKISNKIDYSIVTYPNPTNGVVSIKANDNTVIIGEVEVYNINGQLVKNKNTIVNPYAFDLSNLPNGIYIMKVYSSLGIYNHKIILKK